MEQKLYFRGVPFAVKIEGRGYRWSIQPCSGPPGGAAAGHTAGPSAFRQAVMQSHEAINQWLARHPADEPLVERAVSNG